MTVVLNIVAYSLLALGIIVYCTGLWKSCHVNDKEIVIDERRGKNWFYKFVLMIGVRSYIWAVLSSLVCVSAVYFTHSGHKVLWYSKSVSAPVFFVVIGAAIFVKKKKKEHADSLLFDGISILALTAAIFQLY